MDPYSVSNLGQLTKVSTRTVPGTHTVPVQLYIGTRLPFILPLMIPKKLILLALLAALLAACPAFATSAIYVDIDPSVGLKNSLWINDGGTNTQLYFAGGIDLTIYGPGGVAFPRLVYCVELETEIQVPGDYTTTMDFSDTPSLQRVGYLMENYWPSSSGYTDVALQQHGAAFQLAIWDILTDGGNGFGSATETDGSVSQSTDPAHLTDSDVLADAVEYETLSAGYTSPYGIVYHITDSNHKTVQTLMGPTPDDPGPSAPEPAAVILIFSGLALIGVSRLRRSARNN